jgi:hypothetical protein
MSYHAQFIILLLHFQGVFKTLSLPVLFLQLLLSSVFYVESKFGVEKGGKKEDGGVSERETI